MGNLTKNFSSSEFECPCCGESKMNAKFMEKLQTFRTVMDVPMGIAKGGGYRCEEYSKSSTSAHGEGKAADPLLPSKYLLHKAISVATNLGFTGIGIKNKKGAFQLHLDNAEEIAGKRPRPYIWTY